MSDLRPPARLGAWPARLAYAGAGWLLAGLAPVLLRRRLKAGKELPDRWREKLGQPGLPRPKGRLIWLHAVGLGETMALRGLIAALQAQMPGVQILVTSSTRTSAEVFARDLPQNTRHQFLPLDFPPFLNRFLHHWRPDLVIWSEQDIWPGAVFAAAAKGIPQAWVNARITAESAARRQRMGWLNRPLFRALHMIDAQDQATARRLAQLGADQVTVSGSLKPAAPPIAADPAVVEDLRRALGARKVWVAASTHPADMVEVLAALQVAQDPEKLLILAPRYIDKADEIAASLTDAGISFARRSLGQVPGARDRVWLADTFGELGLWYRLASFALVGGGFDATGGHNPWEAVQLGVPVLHGPNTANFADDYGLLDQAGASVFLAAGELGHRVADGFAAGATTSKAQQLVQEAQRRVSDLAARLQRLMGA